MKGRKLKKKQIKRSENAVGVAVSDDGSSFDKDNNIEAAYDDTSSDASELK